LQSTASTLKGIVSFPQTEAETSHSSISTRSRDSCNRRLPQILSVPSLRKIYDEGGVEGLAMRVPALSKGLLEPERVLKMAQGIKARPFFGPI